MILLLGLQILRVANQMINDSSDANLGLESSPQYRANVLNQRQFKDISIKTDDSIKNNSKNSYLEKQLNFRNNYYEFPLQYNRLQTETKVNNSLPFEVRKYSKQKIIPKPYPYSESTKSSKYNRQTHYKLPDLAIFRNDTFSDINIKPDWSQFEDSIDESLGESDRDDTNSDNNNNEEEKREEDSGDETEETDYKELEDSDDSDISAGFDIDQEDEEVEEESGEDNNMQLNYREEVTPNCSFGHSYCYLDDQYPEDWMRKSIDKQMDILTQILPESTDTFELVEGISKERDENYTYCDIELDLDNSEDSDQTSYPNELHRHGEGGYICPSYVNYIRPKRAQNNAGLWKVILNLNESYRGVDYNQNIRIEECVYEKTKCSYSPNIYKSECIQKYSNERLLAWTPDKGIHLDVFRLPIACSCHLVNL